MLSRPQKVPIAQGDGQWWYTAAREEGCACDDLGVHPVTAAIKEGVCCVPNFHSKYFSKCLMESFKTMQNLLIFIVSFKSTSLSLSLYQNVNNFCCCMYEDVNIYIYIFYKINTSACSLLTYLHLSIKCKNYYI